MAGRLMTLTSLVLVLTDPVSRSLNSSPFPAWGPGGESKWLSLWSTSSEPATPFVPWLSVSAPVCREKAQGLLLGMAVGVRVLR